MLHSFSTNDATIGEYKYTVTIGDDTIKITGTNPDLVTVSTFILFKIIIINIHNKGFFFVRLKNENIGLFSLSEGLNEINGEENWFLGFSDTSSSIYPSWPLRNFIALLIYHR